MKLTYLDHSGFVLETERSTFIFDYYRGALPVLPEAKPLFVFVSHSHGDHFNPDIFELASWRTVYILSDDLKNTRIPEEAAGSTVFIGPHEKVRLTKEDIYRNESAGDERSNGCSAENSADGITIRTLKSNDLGVAFIIEENGKKFYFAGDLNNWWWDGDEEDVQLEKIYHEELARIGGETFDLAFVPLDPRLKDCLRGMNDFMTYCDARVLVPMHMGDHLEVQEALARQEAAGYADRVIRIEKCGQTFDID